VTQVKQVQPVPKARRVLKAALVHKATQVLMQILVQLVRPVPKARWVLKAPPALKEQLVLPATLVLAAPLAIREQLDKWAPKVIKVLAATQGHKAIPVQLVPMVQQVLLVPKVTQVQWVPLVP
jgi:hypothetical protein